jgi:DNA-binding LacI/PurR family transcriptional regulator
MRQYRSSPARPTAIIGFNSVIALGALQAISRSASAARDVSLTGIDDVPWASLVPAHHHGDQPIEEISRVGIDGRSSA